MLLRISKTKNSIKRSQYLFQPFIKIKDRKNKLTVKHMKN